MLCAQLVDYDRFNNSLTKLRDKKEKSLNDEKNLFKVGFLIDCNDKANKNVCYSLNKISK